MSLDSARDAMGDKRFHIAVELLADLPGSPERDLLLAEAHIGCGNKPEALVLLLDLFFTSAGPCIDEPGQRRTLVRLLAKLLEETDAESEHLMGIDPRRLADGTWDIVKAFYLGGARHGFTLAERTLREKRRIAGSVVRGRTIRKGDVFLEFLKKYSSYTPLLYHSAESSVGGGYFFCLEDYGLVVDPGHHFLDNFYRRRRCFDDIDGIAITHFHDDHFADFPSLLALMYQSGRNSDTNGKRFDLFLDEETHSSFKQLFHRSPQFRNRVVLSHGPRRRRRPVEICDGVFLEPLPANHPSNARGGCVGLLITLKKRQIQIFVTGDTGWDERIGSAYRRKRLYDNCVLVAHVSTAYPKEMRTALEGKPQFYPKHLCVHGLKQAIECLNPRTVILSEIGEELGPVILDLAKLVENRYGKRCLVGYDNAIVYVD